MRGSMLRQSLLTNNLSNVDTPGYQREDVNFQGTLQSALASGQSPADVSFSPVTDAGSVQADGNGISSERESAQLAENGLLYENLTSIASTRNTIMKTAIGQPQ
jgi:flagellar basal-body rod protein FlgB